MVRLHSAELIRVILYVQYLYVCSVLVILNSLSARTIVAIDLERYKSLDMSVYDSPPLIIM